MNFAKLKKCFIIAEVSANHGQDFGRAVTMIKKSKAAGADAVKFQLYTADSLTVDAKTKYFMIKHPKWGSHTLHQLYREAYTPWDWFPQLKKIADKEGIIFFATAFDRQGVDFLEKLKVPIHKIASFELVDLPLIKYIAKTKKPLIISTGMATFSEMKDAVSTARLGGAKDIALLRCVSSYPARPEEMNLRTIPNMAKRFACTIGLSDHTFGIASSVAAVSCGAKIIEKHFTLSRALKTPDSFFSIEPIELKQLVDDIRVVEQALGRVHYGLTEQEQKTKVYRRSLFVVADIKKGDKFTEENVRSVRPANGLSPKHIKRILGKKVRRNVKKGTPLSWSLVG